MGVHSPQPHLHAQPQVTMQQPAAQVQDQKPLITSMLASALHPEQKQTLSESCFL